MDAGTLAFRQVVGKAACADQGVDSIVEAAVVAVVASATEEVAVAAAALGLAVAAILWT